jgi:hypothetical protein
VLEKAMQTLMERRDRFGLEEPSSACLTQLAVPSDVRGEERDATRHGFEECIRVVFVSTGHHHEIHCAVPHWQLFMVYTWLNVDKIAV